MNDERRPARGGGAEFARLLPTRWPPVANDDLTKVIPPGDPVRDLGAPLKLVPDLTREVLVAKAGFIPVRGRVYSSAALIEAQVRVLRSGKPEVVKTPGEHRTKGVLVYRTDNGDGVALQNLGVQN